MPTTSVRDNSSYSIATHYAPRTHAAKEFGDYMQANNRVGLTIHEYVQTQSKLGHRLSKADELAILGDKDYLEFAYAQGADGKARRIYFPKGLKRSQLL